MGQVSSDSLINIRAEQLYKYQYLQDSIINSNKADYQSLLSASDEIIELDNRIFQSFIPELLSKNDEQNSHIQELEGIISEKDDKLSEYEKIRIPAIVACGLILVLFILFLILFTYKSIKLKKISFKIENYESSYEENKALMDNYTRVNSELKTQEIELKKQLEKLKLEKDTKIKLLKTDLDNTLNEIKLLQKRQSELTEEFEKEKQTRKLSEDEGMQLKEKNFLLEQNLSSLKKNLDKETQTRKHIEQELRQLLDQLKGL